MLTHCTADAEKDAIMKRSKLEEAITTLKDMKVDIPVLKAAITQIKRNAAIDMAVNALRAQAAKDTIYRQAAIDALGEEPPVWYEGEDEVAERNQWRRDVEAIKALPSAQPEPQWIPVSERLPDVDEDGYSDLVLVSFSNFSVPAILEYRKRDGNGDWFDQTDEDDDPVSVIGLKVNAWMPLPTSYRPPKN